MKIRKRMGMPKARMMSPRRANHAAPQSVPADGGKMSRGRTRTDIVDEQQLAARQRPLLERGAGLYVDAGESTIVKLAARIASRSGYSSPAINREAQAHRSSVDWSSKN